jgi:hypothetical protein
VSPIGDAWRYEALEAVERCALVNRELTVADVAWSPAIDIRPRGAVRASSITPKREPVGPIRVAGVGKRFAWIRSWWFVVLVILLIAVGLAVALTGSGSDTGY